MGDFINTVDPYRCDPERWWVETKIEDPYSLKPEPDNDILLIIGDGWNLLDDLERFIEFSVPFDLMSINYSSELLPASWPIHHFIAGDSHTQDMQNIAKGLADRGTLRHCWNRGSKHFDIRWARNTSKGWTGTTANLGLKIGIALGYMKMVLAGCPMDNNGNWYTKSLPESDSKKNKDHTAHLWKWTEIAGRPIGRFIRSMSGNTAMLFGEPDNDWLLT